MIPFGVNDNIKYLPLSFSIYILDVITFSCVSKALAEILKPTCIHGWVYTRYCTRHIFLCVFPFSLYAKLKQIADVPPQRRLTASNGDNQNTGIIIPCTLVQESSIQFSIEYTPFSFFFKILFQHHLSLS